MKLGFWKNKKILITGINGFVGSNLAKQLLLNGAKVHGITLKKKKIHYLILKKYTNNANYTKVIYLIINLLMKF